MTVAAIIAGLVLLLALAFALRILREYERGVVFRLGRLSRCGAPGRCS